MGSFKDRGMTLAVSKALEVGPKPMLALIIIDTDGVEVGRAMVSAFSRGEVQASSVILSSDTQGVRVI